MVSSWKPIVCGSGASCAAVCRVMNAVNTEAVRSLFSYDSLIHAVAGAVGTAVAMTACYPLDTARARLQIDDAQRERFSLYILAEIIKNEGFTAIYRGLFPLVSTLCCSNFIYFYTFNGLKAITSHSGAEQSALKDLLYAFIAGSVNVLMTAPLWVVNTRLKLQGAKLKTTNYKNTQRQVYSGVLDALRKIGRQEGVRGLWSGTVPSLVLVINPAVQFMVYESLKRHRLQSQQVEELSGLTYFIIGAISKMVATFVTYPIQVVQSKLRDYQDDPIGDELLEDDREQEMEEEVIDNLENDRNLGSNNLKWEHDLISDEKYIVSKSKIEKLVYGQRCDVCGAAMKSACRTVSKLMPAACVYHYTCTEGHTGKWLSTDTYGGKSVIHLLLQISVLMSGLTWAPVELMLRFMGVAVGRASSFYKNQQLYRRGVCNYYEKTMGVLRSQLSSNACRLAVDVRYDSPGFSAGKATCALIDDSTKHILLIEVGDARETGGHSPKLELHLATKAFRSLKAYGIAFTEVISDASSTFIRYFATQHPDVTHHLDVWHKTKRITKCLWEEAKRAANRPLLAWIKPVVNHFWWCCKNSKGSLDRLCRNWLGILHHVTGVHEWGIGRCKHPPMETPDGKEWLNRESTPYKILKSFVRDPEWLKSLRFYKGGHSTSGLECFFSHNLLRYCPKRLHFTLDIYEMRNMLAVLDYNYHLHRETRLTDEGEPYIKSQVSRRTKEWVAYKSLKEKTYGYIPELMAECMATRFSTGWQTGCASERSRNLDRVYPNISGQPAPPARQVYSSMCSRGIERNSTQ